MSEAAASAVKPPQVLACIQAVMTDMAKSGVAKNKTNSAQGFSYRGIDDVMDALSGSLSRHGLIITPHVLEREATVRDTRNGGSMLHVTLKISYDFKAVSDGSIEVVGPIYGEAMDSGDKATNKAMSVAYKYATTQEFCIPISGDDPDAQSHEIVGGAQASREQPPSPPREARVTGASAAREPAPQRENGKPGVMPQRPSGIFGYGKKNYETPWDVMSTRDLTWFLNAERTPQNTREKIVAELAWREHEALQLDAAEAALRLERDKPFDDTIP